MNLSLGGGTARLGAVAATVVLSFSLVACSGSDEPKPLKTTASAKPTPDKAAADEAAVVSLANRYWAAVVESENTGNDSPELFADIATKEVAEIQLGQVGDYKELNLVRVGEPKITEVEAKVSGDTAQILLCKDEDNWTAEVDGQPVEGDQKFGNGSWGAKASKIDGRWLISEVVTTKDGEKSCA